MGLSRETVQAVKERSDILQIIGEKVALQRAGADFKGLCPFHHEKTPSFIVSPSKRMFKCFGCGTGGSVIDFVMSYDRAEFGEAVETLAQRLGLETGRKDGPRRDNPVPRLLQAARSFYHERLLHAADGAAARDYLTQRGFGESDWTAFGLGYAPNGWQGLSDKLSASGYAETALLASGLVRKGSSGRAYDFMRHRVLFPILDGQGHCIAFGGRAIDPGDTPKYLNTPETPYYQKHRILFALFQSAEAMRRSRRAILCEGYLDVLRLHQAGFREAVATCGTALTAAHLQVLERHADRVLLVFDGDAAGIKAALRSAALFLSSRLEAHVVALPDGLDPDDFIAARGPEAFETLAAAAAPILEYAVEQTLRTHGNTVHGKQQALGDLVPLLAAVKQEAARGIALAHVAHLLELPIDSVSRTVQHGRSGPGPDGGRPRAASLHRTATDPAGPSGVAQPAPLPPPDRQMRHQRRMLSYLLRKRELLGHVRGLVLPEELTDPEVRQVFEKLLRLTDEEFQALSDEELLWMFPDLAPQLQALLLDEPVTMSNIFDYHRALLQDVAEIKKALNKRLREHLRKVTGTPDEGGALQRVKALSDQIAGLRTAAATTATEPRDNPQPVISRATK